MSVLTPEFLSSRAQGPAWSPNGNGMSAFAETIYHARYAWKDRLGTGIESWSDTAYRVASTVLGVLGFSNDSPLVQNLHRVIYQKKFIPGGRYLYSVGREYHQVNNCTLLRAEDSREGWAELSSNVMMASMTGAGVGVDYSALRPEGTAIKKTGGVSSGPLALMKLINEVGRNVMQGGMRRSALWAGLNWKHDDIFKFIHMKNWSSEIQKMKEKDFFFPATMDLTNISVQLDDEFFDAYYDTSHTRHKLAHQVYWTTVMNMLTTAEPGFSVDVGPNSVETLRNACTELTSSDDSDICNLGSINLSRVESLQEMQELVELGTLFLLAGSVYSHLPYPKVGEVRNKNRRLGLGLMGIHEWLAARSKPYGPDPELELYLSIYAGSTPIAHRLADHFNISRPVKTRALAPNGTIGSITETTTGIEPIFCVAYRRRYVQANGNGNGRDKSQYQYVVDPTAKRLIDQGIDPGSIEDSYSLAAQYERRIAFQAWVQRFVDHGISSTLNLPGPITDDQGIKQFGDTLIRYLPHLRGITVYPNGCRNGQPLTPVPYQEAVSKEGTVFEGNEESCKGGVCGI